VEVKETTEEQQTTTEELFGTVEVQQQTTTIPAVETTSISTNEIPETKPVTEPLATENIEIEFTTPFDFTQDDYFKIKTNVNNNQISVQEGDTIEIVCDSITNSYSIEISWINPRHEVKKKKIFFVIYIN